MNSYVTEESPSAQAILEGLDILTTLAGVLGLDLLDGNAGGEDRELGQALEALMSELGKAAVDGKTIDENMAALLGLRQEFRKDKNFAGADRIRDALNVAGVVLEDTAQGPRWHKA
jgi:cysteinyl-tRNA synthetase